MGEKLKTVTGGEVLLELVVESALIHTGGCSVDCESEFECSVWHDDVDVRTSLFVARSKFCPTPVESSPKEGHCLAEGVGIGDGRGLHSMTAPMKSGIHLEKIRCNSRTLTPSRRNCC